jgi:hypothetical protein
MRLIHKSPLGALEIPGVLGMVNPGEPFTIPDEDGVVLLAQADLYAPADGFKSLIVEQLVSVAEGRRIDTDGLKKADLIAALTAGKEKDA